MPRKSISTSSELAVACPAKLAPFGRGCCGCHAGFLPSGACIVCVDGGELSGAPCGRTCPPNMWCVAVLNLSGIGGCLVPVWPPPELSHLSRMRHPAHGLPRGGDAEHMVAASHATALFGATCNVYRIRYGCNGNLAKPYAERIGMKLKYGLIFFVLLIAIVLIGIYRISNPETTELDEAERARLGGTYVELSDGITHYKLEGRDGRGLVVLVHGGRVPMWAWDKQAQSLIHAGFRVLRYDMYGRGYSDRPEVTYNRELYQRQLLELVNMLDLPETFDLVGFSFGGATAVNFTAHNTSRVGKLVLISPVVNNFQVPSVFRIPIVGDFVARVFGVKMITQRFISSRQNDPQSGKYIELFREQTTYEGFQQSMLSLIRDGALVGDYTAAYRTVGSQKRDVLLIWGTEDTEVTKQMISRIHSLIPHLEYEPVEGVGHSILFQRPVTVSNLMIQFLNRGSAPTSSEHPIDLK